MNQAFIDGQNLIYSSRNENPAWKVDLKKFKIYLEEKYNVIKAFYFIGYYDSRRKNIYNAITNSGYELVFRKHVSGMYSTKKCNVDTDIVFEIMKKLVEREKFNKVVLVSGDGDYFKLVEYLIKKDKFLRLLAPNEHRMSSLYKTLPSNYCCYLSRNNVVKKIGKKIAGSA